MSPASLLTYSPLPHDPNRVETAPRRPKAKAPTPPKQGVEMKCAAPKTALPSLRPLKQ